MLESIVKPMTNSQSPEVLDAAMFRLGQELRRLRVTVNNEVTYAIGTSFWELSLLKNKGALRVSEIASLINLDVSTVSRQLKALNEKGLVERTLDEADGRAAYFELTAAGHEVFDTLTERRRSVISEALKGWDAKSRASLASLLDRLNDDLSLAIDARCSTSKTS